MLEMETEEAVEFIAEWPPPMKRVRCDAAPSNNRPHFNTAHEPEDVQLFEEKPIISPEEVLLAESDSSLSVDRVLAKWWKSKDSSTYAAQIANMSSNPNTQLHYIARLPQAQRFLKHRYNFLRKEAIRYPRPGLYTALASCSQKLGHNKEGAEYCQQALRWMLKDREACCPKTQEVGSPKEREVGVYLQEDGPKMEVGTSEINEVQWLLNVLLRQADVEEMARSMQVKGCVPRGVVSVMPVPIEVERRCHEQLSCEEFYTKYACGHIPVIITGLVSHMTSTPWTLDHIKKIIGEKLAPLKRVVPSSVEWAKLEPAGVSTVQEFVESLDTVSDADMKYLFDWSLPLHCPDLMKELQLPIYFADNLLQQTPPGTLYHDSWPSLFIAPKGLCSELHVDAFGSNFWMALFEGKKRWLLFPPADLPCLYPMYTHSTDASFQVNLAAPDLSLHPLLTLTHPWECVLQPGELLFVPSGCPHRVENVEKSLAISANFVDRSNVAKVLEELKINALMDDRSADLLEALQSMG